MKKIHRRKDREKERRERPKNRELARLKRKIEKKKKERERHCSPQMEDRRSRERKDSPRLLSLPFMRAGPLILHGFCQDPTEMHQRNLHTRSSGISPPHGCLSSSSPASSHFIFPRPSTSLPWDVPRASPSSPPSSTPSRPSYAPIVSSSLLFEFSEKPRLSDRRQLCTAVHQVSRGAQTNRILRTEQWRQPSSELPISTNEYRGPW